MSDEGDKSAARAGPPGPPPRPKAAAPSSSQSGEISAPDLPSSSQLKLVTITPRLSMPDGEISQITQADGTPMMPKKDPYIGCTIDARYKVESVLGEGGMGIVYQCRHTIIGKKVAMKVLRADLARDKEVTERFLNEAKSASAIGNAHIIDISDFGQFPDGSTYFVMEYLDGLPLTNIVEGGKAVPVQRILDVARQLAEGLHAAHEAGIVHRDLKPDNIFLIERGANKDFVKILDFGIAKVSTGGEGKLTRAGAVFGTPHYMSPEQAAGAPVDHRGDIYSFGVILYELASGKVPFDADNFMGILTQHMYKAPVPIRALVPAPQEVPPGLEAIVLKCLSKRPEQRYQSMQELLGDVDKLKSGAIPDAVPEMMGRSGGFNVPADYFKKGGAGMPAPVPASPLDGGMQRTRWPVYAGVAGVFTAMVIVIAIFAASSKSTATTTPTSEAIPSAEPKEATPAPVVTPAVVKKAQVVIAIEPTDAKVLQDGEEIGSSPLLLQVAEGDSIKLEIKREGFKPQTVEVDGSKQKLIVTLVKVPSARVYPVARPELAKPKPKPKPKPTITDPGLVNPWGE